MQRKISTTYCKTVYSSNAYLSLEILLRFGSDQCCLLSNAVPRISCYSECNLHVFAKRGSDMQISLATKTDKGPINLVPRVHRLHGQRFSRRVKLWGNGIIRINSNFFGWLFQNNSLRTQTYFRKLFMKL